MSLSGRRAWPGGGLASNTGRLCSSGQGPRPQRTLRPRRGFQASAGLFVCAAAGLAGAAGVQLSVQLLGLALRARLPPASLPLLLLGLRLGPGVTRFSVRAVTLTEVNGSPPDVSDPTPAGHRGAPDRTKQTPPRHSMRSRPRGRWEMKGPLLSLPRAVFGAHPPRKGFLLLFRN